MTYANFGDFISRKRIEKKITIRKMADMLGVSAPFLTDVEKDRRNPFDIEKLNQLAHILELTKEEKNEMLNLAGKKRKAVAPRFAGIYYATRLCERGTAYSQGFGRWRRGVEAFC